MLNRHAIASATLSGLALAAVGCSLHKSSGTLATPATSFAYSATASVGDFVSITVDEAARTITYDNRSTGESGVASYHVDVDGSYAIDSDTGTMAPVRAYEVPGYAFIMAANHTGAGGVPSVITAIHAETIAPADMAGSYNYMQFRTNSGGVEIGDVTIAPAVGGGSITPNSYWPFGAINNDPGSLGYDVGFQGGNSMSMASVEQGLGNLYLRAPEGGGQYSYIFRTTGGFFAVDTPNGGLVCLRKAAAKDFVPANAGAYQAMVFAKSGATTGMGNVESPATGSVAKWSIAVASDGHLTVTDAGAATVVPSQVLTPFADAAYLHGGTKVVDGCFGAFTVRIPAPASGPHATDTPTDVFVMFLSDSLLISSFTGHQDGSYDYWYGVGLRDPGAGG